MNNNLNYQEVIDHVGGNIFDMAYAYCVDFAADPNLSPTYFTDPQTFEPHAWVVAAVASILFELAGREKLSERAKLNAH